MMPAANRSDCVLCDLIAGCIPRWVIHETESTVCFLPLELNAYGHTLIAPKAHFADLLDIPEPLLQELAITAKQLTSHYQQALGTTGVNLLHATGADAGQSVAHFHWHLLPRFANDGLSAWPDLPVLPVNKDELLARLHL